MKAITLCQPWAGLVAAGVKTIETRTWSTDYRGPLAIHAAKGFGYLGGISGYRRVCSEEPMRGTIERHPDYLTETFGAVLCVVDLVGVYPVTAVLFGIEEFLSDVTPGRFAWMLKNLKLLDLPIPARGKQGLWEWTEAGGS